MIIELLTWDRVDVECPDDQKLNRSYKNAYVELGKQSLPECSLNIRENNPYPKSALYARGKIVSLSPSGFVAEAVHWCSYGDNLERYEEKPVIIKGYF